MDGSPTPVYKNCILLPDDGNIYLRASLAASAGPGGLESRDLEKLQGLQRTRRRRKPMANHWMSTVKEVAGSLTHHWGEEKTWTPGSAAKRP
ncbi:hypothetical protein D9613_004450 [Agrocybe pediades]|uniref:Uncharacterized protein n=1 Tax=Agrocybe pediades TaxID=84607 RepID=A0A8H4QI12_9AGAR|nr:hypothetical protein D9613_004450 [Agrocybe pediades]